MVFQLAIRNSALRARAGVIRTNSTVFARSFGSASDDIKMLEKLLRDAKARESGAGHAAVGTDGGDAGAGGVKFNIGTFNAISSKGLAKSTLR